MIDIFIVRSFFFSLIFSYYSFSHPNFSWAKYLEVMVLEWLEVQIIAFIARRVVRERYRYALGLFLNMITLKIHIDFDMKLFGGLSKRTLCRLTPFLIGMLVHLFDIVSEWRFDHVAARAARNIPQDQLLRECHICFELTTDQNGLPYYNCRHTMHHTCFVEYRVASPVNSLKCPACQARLRN